MAKVELLDYEKDVVKIQKLKSRNEKLCYLYRYNSQVLISLGKYKESQKQNSAFMGFKTILSEKRYFEIMHLADTVFYEKLGI